MYFTILTSVIINLIESKILNPVCYINRPSKHKHDLVYRFHIPGKGHDLSWFVLDIDQILKLLCLTA